jgi:lysophospholipase L1-like esterase
MDTGQEGRSAPRAGERRTRRRLVVFIVLAGLGSVLVVGLAVEVVARLCGYAGHDLTGFRSLHRVSGDPDVVYELVPGRVATVYHPQETRYVIGERGFRVAREGGADEGGAIACLGDSVVFGWGVAGQDLFTTRLAAALDRTPGLPRGVMNWGVSGYSTYNERALLARRGPEFQPAVGFLFFCWNDLDHPAWQYAFTTNRKLAGRVPEAAVPNRAAPPDAHGGGGAGWGAFERAWLGLSRHSAAAFLVGQRANALLYRHGVRGRERRLARYRAAAAPDSPERRWLAGQVGAIVRIAGVWKGRVVVCVLADVVPGEAANGLYARAAASVGSLAEAAGADVLDLSPALLEAGGGTFLDGVHLSREGHRIVARELLSYLRVTFDATVTGRARPASRRRRVRTPGEAVAARRLSGPGESTGRPGARRRAARPLRW